MKDKYLQLIWLRGVGALKADAENSYLGMIWWILEPVLLTMLFYLAFSTGLRGAGGEDFALFLVCGMLPFQWTSSCFTGASSSILSNKGVMGQVHIPKWIFPSCINLSMALRYAFVLPILLAYVIYNGKTPTIEWTGLIYIVSCQIIFNLGISYVISSWSPLIPDLIHIVPLAIMALMFTSGIFFDINERPEDIQRVLRINPFIEVVDGYRAILLRGESIEYSKLFYTWAFGFSCIVLGLAALFKFDRYYPRALP